MTNHGDDCYFYYYSYCTKGDSCPFRHCEAARGSEIVCSLWEEGRCFRPVCKFRHMEITKNRKEIPCYWEKQPAGCQKPHCVFLHKRPRSIDGIFVPWDKSQIKTEEQQHEEPAPPPAAPLPTTTNPQLRGIKTDSQEPVPSPTHPPVVINPADDDEDEDDQFSEEGEDGKGGPSPRKLPRSGDSLNFGVSTLEEIRLRKALKASMKRAGYPIQSAETSTSREKENIRLFCRPAFSESRGPPFPEEGGRPRGSVVERLGSKIPESELMCGDGVPLRRSLAERLGRVVDEEQRSAPPQKALKPVKDRLGLLSAPAGPTPPAENNGVSVQAPEQIRIKTLEEIRQEKAAKSQSKREAPAEVSPEITKTNTTKAPKGIKRAITVKDTPISHVKTFSEILRAKKRKEEEEQNQKSSPKRTKLVVEKSPSKSQGESDMAQSSPEDTNKGKVIVKTLEEIRREKAARLQAQQAVEAESKKSSDSEENGAKKPRLLRLKTPPAQTGSATAEPTAEVKEKPLKTPAAAPETRNRVKVKTFEEIMQEKRLRKQEMGEQPKGSAEAESSEKQICLKRKLPPKIRLTPLNSSPAAPPKDQDQKLVSFTSESASPANNTPDTIAAATVPTEQQTQVGFREVPDRNTRISAARPSAKPTREAPESHDEPTAENNQMKAPEPAADSKVRPKLNVKPSIMKPAVQVKPGPKKRGAARSAVAAVKPLNSASTGQEESPQESPCRDRQSQVISALNAQAQLTSAVPRRPSTLLDSASSSSPPREELQTVPVFKQSPGQDAKPAVSAASVREACAVPQSPVLKSPTQSRSRRQSTAASRAAPTSSTDAAASTSAVDDFEELINQFTDDHLEEDVDPGLGEDDLLQELSEMIDS